jgi:hypothetical protein
MGRQGVLWALAFALWGGQARADDWWHEWPAARFPAWNIHPDYPVMGGYGGVGAWCVGVAPNGVWAFSYGYVNTAYHCERARRWVVSHEGPVAVPSQAGFFAIDGYNRVVVNCAGWSWVQQGWGWMVVEAAFRAAQQSQSRYCRFAVAY